MIYTPLNLEKVLLRLLKECKQVLYILFLQLRLPNSKW